MHKLKLYIALINVPTYLPKFKIKVVEIANRYSINGDAIISETIIRLFFNLGCINF